MARPLRIEFKDAWYHLMNRGAGKQDIFLHNKHCKFFISILKDITAIYSIEIHAYCLMKNHYHLLMKTPLGNLSKAMQHLSGMYTRYFNYTEKRDGPLFRGRYKSIIVDGLKYLLDVSKYIHLNPVKAAIVAHPEDYYWSSYKSYITATNQEEWLYKEKILGYFGECHQSSEYKNFVCRDVVQNEVDELCQSPCVFGILGDKQAKIVLNQMVKQKVHAGKTGISSTCDQCSLENLRAIIVDYYKINAEQFSCKYNRDFIIYKYVFMYVARYVCKYNLKEIALFFGDLTPSNVSRSVTKVRNISKKDEQLRQDLIKITQLIDKSKIQCLTPPFDV